MFGSFTESALLQYEEQVKRRSKSGEGVQGTEFHDNNPHPEESDEFAESYDFARCIRADGSLYGIADGKKCRKGTETKVAHAGRKTESKRKQGIRKRGEASLKRATAERVLDDLRRQGAKEKETKAAAEERRRQKDPYTNRDRVEQIQGLVGKATVALQRLQDRRKAVKKETDYSRKLDARIARLQSAISKLQNEKYRLQKQNPPKSEGFGRIPAAFETGRSLA